MTIPLPAPPADAATRRTDLLEAVKSIEAFEYRQVIDIAATFNQSLAECTLDTAMLAALSRLRTLLAETDLPREEAHAEYLLVVRAVYAPFRAEEAARMGRTRKKAVRRFRESAAWERYGGMAETVEMRQAGMSARELITVLLVFCVGVLIVGAWMRAENGRMDAGAQAQEVTP